MICLLFSAFVKANLHAAPITRIGSLDKFVLQYRRDGIHE